MHNPKREISLIMEVLENTRFSLSSKEIKEEIMHSYNETVPRNNIGIWLNALIEAELVQRTEDNNIAYFKLANIPKEELNSKLEEEVLEMKDSKISELFVEEDLFDRQMRELNEVLDQANSLHKKSIICPNCNSTNTSKIGTVGRAASIGIFGLASSSIGKTYKCNKCGYKW